MSRQLAAQVNNKRTPTGQFFTTINPTLYEKQSPPATFEGMNTTDTAMATMRASGRLSNSLGSDGRNAGEQTGTYGTGGAEASYGGTTTLPPIAGGDGTGKRPNWLLPWQTGDRQLGAHPCLAPSCVRARRRPRSVARACAGCHPKDTAWNGCHLLR